MSEESHVSESVTVSWNEIQQIQQIVTRVMTLDERVRVTMYADAGTWARHHHNLVWLNTSFGVAGGMSAILATLSERSPLLTTATCLAAIVVMYFCHRMAHGHRQLWREAKLLQYAIEHAWGLRDGLSSASPRHVIGELAREQVAMGKPWSRSLRAVQARGWLHVVCIALASAIAIIAWVIY
jgi:hypothetical protein